MLENFTKQQKCEHCENYFIPKDVAEKFEPVWWTDFFCSPECALHSRRGYIIKTTGEGTIRFTITLPIDIYERMHADSQKESRTLNGQVNFIVKNYYVWKDIEASRL